MIVRSTFSTLKTSSTASLHFTTREQTSFVCVFARVFFAVLFCGLEHKSREKEKSHYTYIF